MRPIAFLGLLVACTHAPPADPLRVEALLEQTSATTFQLVLRPSRPVARLLFARPGDGDRLRTWRIVEPAAARFVTSGDREEVVAGSPIERLVLEVPIHRYLPENDYAPFLLLSGGGVLVYTGQWDVEGAAEQTFELRPSPGDFVVVAGLSARGPLRWTSVDDGTYAAFGPVEPVEEARFVALIDAGFPRWLREEARALLPRLFDHFAAALGRELPFRPAVLLSYSEEAEHPRSISLKGGTLTGLLQQDVRLGSKLSAAGEPLVLEAFRASLAHEAAHLWNTRVIRPRGPDWIHEGGADLLAWRALRALGIFSAEQYEARLSSARSECRSRRGSGPLSKASVRARYSCGAVIEAAAPNPEALWAALLRRGREYDEESFFEALRLAGTSDEALRSARALASERP